MTITLIAKWCLTALLAVAPVVAQDMLKAEIPFAFTAGVTAMPAGTYYVKFQIPGVVQIVRSDYTVGSLIFASGIQAKEAPHTGKLVFNRYGDSYFLSQIWKPGVEVGKQLPKSKPEREFAKTFDNVRRASVSASTNVTLTAHR